MGLMNGHDYVRKVAEVVDVTTEMHFSLFFTQFMYTYNNFRLC